jgi:hypothetical protein
MRVSELGEAAWMHELFSRATTPARGCRWLATETGSETPERPNPSLHNMRRKGLT